MSRNQKLKKVLVANRGEIAVRVIRACREESIATVAVYSDADRSALHVRLADEAVRIGPAPAGESYLRADRILEAARQSGAEAVHPGYGFLSENAEFVRACTAAGVVFIGPSADVMRDMGDKVRARARMIAAGVPVVPGSEGEIGDEAELKRVAGEIGFPVMIKASAGGGGKGIRVVRDQAELASAFARARSEAEASFGNGAVYIEKFLEKPRHVEIQVLADHHGNVVHLGERECSVQRRHQKVLEETPSTAVNADLRARMGEAAVCAVREVGYTNAGTVEFLLDASGEFHFLEMNTRLQVEHPITEQVTGIDLVRSQLRIAAGEPLGFSQDDIGFHGHAIEVRICAEDPDRDFMPATGTVKHLDFPGGGRVRVDASLFEGMKVDVHYDSMLAKLIVRGGDREECLARMNRALSEFHVTGVRTNISFLLRVLANDEIVRGEYDTGFVERNMDSLRAPPDDAEALRVALVAAALAHELRRVGSLKARGDVGKSTSNWVHAARSDGMRGRP